MKTSLIQSRQIIHVSAFAVYRGLISQHWTCGLFPLHLFDHITVHLILMLSHLTTKCTHLTPKCINSLDLKVHSLDQRVLASPMNAVYFPYPRIGEPSTSLTRFGHMKFISWAQQFASWLDSELSWPQYAQYDSFSPRVHVLKPQVNKFTYSELSNINLFWSKQSLSCINVPCWPL